MELYKILIIVGAVLIGLIFLATLFSASSANNEYREKTVILTGSQEVPPNISQANGILRYTYKPSEKAIHYESHYSGLSSEYVSSHFHSGRVGENGPILKEVEFRDGRASGVWTLTDSDVEKLINNSIYFNIHSRIYPDGEIRGQL